MRFVITAAVGGLMLVVALVLAPQLAEAGYLDGSDDAVDAALQQRLHQIRQMALQQRVLATDAAGARSPTAIQERRRQLLAEMSPEELYSMSQSPQSPVGGAFYDELLQGVDGTGGGADTDIMAPADKRACVRRGGNCDHRPNDCCYSSSCRCNLWGSNCRCQRMGLFQKWG